MRPFLVFFMGLVTLTSFLVVAEVGKTTAQNPIVVVDSTSPPMGEPSAKSLKEFRAAMLKVVDESVRAGELPRRASVGLRIRFTLFPEQLKAVHQAAAEQCLADGLCASYGAIDWSQLLAFLKEFIPILMEIIKMFAMQNRVHSEYLCDSFDCHYSLAA